MIPVIHQLQGWKAYNTDILNGNKKCAKMLHFNQILRHSRSQMRDRYICNSLNVTERFLLIERYSSALQGAQTSLEPKTKVGFPTCLDSGHPVFLGPEAHSFVPNEKS